MIRGTRSAGVTGRKYQARPVTFSAVLRVPSPSMLKRIVFSMVRSNCRHSSGSMPAASSPNSRMGWIWKCQAIVMPQTHSMKGRQPATSMDRLDASTRLMLAYKLSAFWTIRASTVVRSSFFLIIGVEMFNQLSEGSDGINRVVDCLWGCQRTADKLPRPDRIPGTPIGFFLLEVGWGRLNSLNLPGLKTSSDASSFSIATGQKRL